MEFSRRIQMDFYGQVIYVVSVEDLLISKLIWIWLSKSPMERLKQMMEDNTALNAFWAGAKKQLPKTPIVLSQQQAR